MFERYTETARQSVFFARYEASQFGIPFIDAECLLLGVLRADPALAARLLQPAVTVDALREEIRKQISTGKRFSAAVDLPFSKEAKRALAHGAEQAKHPKHIGPAHLLLGLFHEEQSVAAKLIRANGITMEKLREVLELPSPVAPTTAPVPPAGPAPAPRDLTAAARRGTLSPLIGRQRELERTIQILARRTKNNPVLVGEPGVGKTAIVLGLAQRIADGSVPAGLADRSIVVFDASALIAPRGPGQSAPQLAETAGHPLLYVQGLFDLAVTGSGWGVVEAMRMLDPCLSRGEVQCIATGTPYGFRQTLDRGGALARHFEAVEVAPPSEADTLEIVSSAKEQYERFHGVVYTKETIAAAVALSRRFLKHRHPPDRAIDLIDEAGARVKLRREAEPREAVELRRRIRQISRNAENAIVNNEFEKAERYSEEEKQQRQELYRLLEAHKQNLPDNTIRPEDLEEVVAERIGVPVVAVRSAMRVEAPAELDPRLPLAGLEWMSLLEAYLAECSEEDAERLAQAIREVKDKLTQ